MPIFYSNIYFHDDFKIKERKHHSNSLVRRGFFFKESFSRTKTEFRKFAWSEHFRTTHKAKIP